MKEEILEKVKESNSKERSCTRVFNNINKKLLPYIHNKNLNEIAMLYHLANEVKENSLRSFLIYNEMSAIGEKNEVERLMKTKPKENHMNSFRKQFEKEVTLKNEQSNIDYCIWVEYFEPLIIHKEMDEFHTRLSYLKGGGVSYLKEQLLLLAKFIKTNDTERIQMQIEHLESFKK